MGRPQLVAVQPTTGRRGAVRPPSLSSDDSVRRHRKRRLIVPPDRAGARVEAENTCPLLTISGMDSPPVIDCHTEVPGARQKSGGVAHRAEAIQTRNHTKRPLTVFGGNVACDGRPAAIGRGRRPGTALTAAAYMSSVAGRMVAAASFPGSDIVIEGVGLSPTCIRILGSQVESRLA